MKKTYFLKGMLLLFLAFPFTSCNDEPLEGEFLEDTGGGMEMGGQFTATVAGQPFVADAASGIDNDGTLLIAGSKVSGETVSISVENAEVGTFDLTYRVSNPNLATYIEDGNSQPYLTRSTEGGSGELIITEMDNENNTLSGTFEFIAVRIQLDSSGEPVLDDNGNYVIEEIHVQNGSFNSIQFMTLGGREGK